MYTLTIYTFYYVKQMEFQDGYFIFVVNSLLQRWPIGWHYFSLFLYMMTVAWSIHVTPVIFYFRYTLICKWVSLGQFASVRKQMFAYLTLFTTFCVQILCAQMSSAPNVKCAKSYTQMLGCAKDGCANICTQILGCAKVGVRKCWVERKKLNAYVNVLYRGVQLSVFKLARFTMALFLPVFSEILSLAYATYLSEERRPELCLKLFWEDVPADDDPHGCRRPSPLCVLSRLVKFCSFSPGRENFFRFIRGWKMEFRCTVSEFCKFPLHHSFVTQNLKY